MCLVTCTVTLINARIWWLMALFTNWSEWWWINGWYNHRLYNLVYGTNKVRLLLASYPVTLAIQLASLALKVLLAVQDRCCCSCKCSTYNLKYITWPYFVGNYVHTCIHIFNRGNLKRAYFGKPHVWVCAKNNCDVLQKNQQKKLGSY